MKITRQKNFIEPLKKLYPGLDERTIKRIINQGCHNIATYLKNEEDVLLISSRKKIKFLIYQYRNFSSEKQKNAACHKEHL